VIIFALMIWIGGGEYHFQGGKFTTRAECVETWEYLHRAYPTWTAYECRPEELK
jgi:hypothetical protein